MTITMMLFGGVVLVMVLYVALQPLLSERQVARVAKQRYDQHYTLQDVRVRYELLLGSIVDLDADFDMGKISDAAYDEQRKMLIGRSVSMRRKLDELEATLLSVNEDQLESMIQQHRIQRQQHIEDEIEAAVAAARHKGV